MSEHIVEMHIAPSRSTLQAPTDLVQIEGRTAEGGWRVVAAVNGYELATQFIAAPALVAALEDIEEQFRKWWPGCLECECEEGRECLLCHGRLVLDQARAALTLARGES